MISETQIEQLRNEAAVAGDLVMVAICDRALDGDLVAVQRCATVIADAAAQG